MSVKENEELALTVIEGLNTRDLSQWSQKLSDDYAAEYPGVPMLNKAQSIGYNERFVIAFPDTHFEIHSVVAQGDRVFIHWMVSGTQTERLATVTGRTIPPTRRRATVSGVLLTEGGRTSKRYKPRLRGTLSRAGHPCRSTGPA